jgi:RNA polymerase sigma-70 factor (sigma-E family)
MEGAMTEQLDEEFRQFMHGRWPTMVRLAYGLTGELGHAEDVAQAAFAKAYASWPRVIRSENPDAYVRKILINENRNRFRRRRVRELSTGSLPETGVSDALRDVDDRSALLAALQALASRQRAVVVLRYWLDLSETESAAALNTPSKEGHAEGAGQQGPPCSSPPLSPRGQAGTAGARIRKGEHYPI